MKNQTNRMVRGGFTLIELLVVIAIIAILAAILFPVFAQARNKARQASTLSNHKQVALGMIMYSQDYDETYVQGSTYHNVSGQTPPSPYCDSAGNCWVDGWAQRIGPYLKSVQVFRSPSDSGFEDPNVDSFGPYLSIAANALAGGVPGLGDNATLGIVGAGFPWAMGETWPGPGTTQAQPQANVNRPSETIMLADKMTDDTAYDKNGPGLIWIGNKPRFQPMSMMLWDTATGQDFYAWTGGLIPNGRRPANAGGKWHLGPRGGVSIKFNGLCNFAFADGHVKAMKPEQTNPDPINRPQDNMWNALRK